jgi:hypothetical protein
MCARLSAGRAPKATERPTPGTPWTEILECAGAHALANFDGESAMVAYVDARLRFRRVSTALSRLSARDQEVLGAYYGCEPSEHPLGALAEVASLTGTAQGRNRARAARGMHEPIEATVRWLAAATAPDARAALGEVRDEANAILAAARARYALARETDRGRAAV